MGVNPPNPPSNPPSDESSHEDHQAFGSGATRGRVSEPAMPAVEETPPPELPAAVAPDPSADQGVFEEDFSDIGSASGRAEEDGQGVSSAVHDAVDAVTDFVDDIVDEVTDLVD